MPAANTMVRSAVSRAILDRFFMFCPSFGKMYSFLFPCHNYTISRPKKKAKIAAQRHLFSCFITFYYRTAVSAYPKNPKYRQPFSAGTPGFDVSAWRSQCIMPFSASISSSTTIGLDKKPFMPQSNACFRSSSNTLAVMATIGTAARAGSFSARMRWVAV